MFSFIENVFQPFIFGDVINLRELKNVFFYREIVFQNLSPFPNFSHFVEFGVIYCDFCIKYICGDVISLMGLDKIFSFIESVSVIFREFGVYFL